MQIFTNHAENTFIYGFFLLHGKAKQRSKEWSKWRGSDQYSVSPRVESIRFWWQCRNMPKQLAKTANCDYRTSLPNSDLCIKPNTCSSQGWICIPSLLATQPCFRNQMKKPEHYALLDASETEPDGFATAGCLQPSAKELHLTWRHSRLADFLVDLPRPTNSSPTWLKEKCKIIKCIMNLYMFEIPDCMDS